MTTEEVQERGMARLQELSPVTGENIKYGPMLNWQYGDRHEFLLYTAFQHFAAHLYDKAMKARDKYGFHPLGWATPDWEAELQKGLAEHLLKGDPRDVAVYAMFAWFHGWPTPTPTLLATVEEGPASEAATSLRNEADEYAAKQGLLPDGSLIFTRVAEAYEAGATRSLSSLEGGAGALTHKAALVAIREWHEDCEYAVLKRGDKDYIQAANYAPEYVRAVNLLLNIISPTDGKCVACNAVRYVLPGQTWGSCSNNECATYKEDVASASYLDEAQPASPTTSKKGPETC